MIVLLLSSTLSLFIFITFGVFFAKTVKAPADFTEKILMGLVVSNTITTWLSLFYPINGFILLAIFLGCSFLLFLIRDEIKTVGSLLYENKYIIFSSLPFILIALIISVDPPHNYDTGLYHLQSIKWIEKYPVVPGLANLHGRFGYNPNIFTFFALTSLYDLFQQEIFSVNFTVFTVLVVYFVGKLYSLIKREGVSNIFVIYIFAFYHILQLRNNLSSPTPDFLSITIPLFIFIRMVDLSAQKENAEFRSYIPILILSIYIVTVKLAALPIVLLSVFIIIRYRFELQNLFRMLPLLSLIILPWLIRNIILTGWLVYPFATIDLFNFDWKVTLAKIIGEREAVTGWARSPGEHYIDAANMDFLGWFPIWWQRLDLWDRLSFVSSLCLPVLALIGQLSKKIKIGFFTNAIIITSFTGVLFWLYMAPDFRFGKAFIVIAAISPLLFIKFDWMPKCKSNIAFSVLMILSIGYYARENDIFRKITSQTLYSNRMIIPQKIEIPLVVNFRAYNINGLDINMPTVGDRCFDYPLPCTPYFDATLKLRGLTLDTGFTSLSNTPHRKKVAQTIFRKN